MTSTPHTESAVAPRTEEAAEPLLEHHVAGGRVQLALNVSDVPASVEFYSTLFGVPPTKLRPGYANFAIAHPPLKLVLIEDSRVRSDGVLGALNHLGVEVPTSAAVRAATQDLRDRALATRTQDGVTCCHAVQDKVWVHDPDGAPWEVYTVLADAPADSSDDSSTPPSVEAAGATTSQAVEAAPAATAQAGSACCDAHTATSCCDADAKSSCCGNQTDSVLPTSCGCAS